MKCREITTLGGVTATLTEDEERFVRALERISKMKRGKIYLFANGTLDLRYGDAWSDNSFGNHSVIGVQCEGGDGGDNLTTI